MTRLDNDTYARVKAAGFKWAPKQELFFAPAWTPEREDLLIELCGEIGDEDTSLVDRAEDRAERFETYSEKRAGEAEMARKAVDVIADNIPLGQPILVSHHSEKHARKDKQRIENGMRKAVKLWETSKYWTDRAAGALAHAKYKELPAVRHRRIKGLEADLRKKLKEKEDAENFIKLWSREGLSLENAKAIANYDHISRCFPLGEYPRQEGASTYEGQMSLWSALDGIIGPEQARDIAIPAHTRTIDWCNRWIAHLENRIAYEKAMLGEQGGIKADQWTLEVGGQILAEELWLTITKLNKSGGRINSVSTNNKRWPRVVAVESIRDYKAPTEEAKAATKKATKLPPLCNYPGEGFQHITQEKWDKTHKDYKSTKVIKATDTTAAHRVRSGMIGTGYSSSLLFITDAKITYPPPIEGAKEVPSLPAPEHDLPTLERQAQARAAWRVENEEKTPFDAMKEALKNGVQVVVADQLFPTPMEIARQMVRLAELIDGERILEPSAGTGHICRVIREVAPDARIEAVEINGELGRLANKWATSVRQADFLQCKPEDLGVFRYCLMNPPFAPNAADVAHVLHALNFLKEGGRLVSVVANGPRQREKLEPLATAWIDLPDGSFKEAGTNVNTAIVVIDK